MPDMSALEVVRGRLEDYRLAYYLLFDNRVSAILRILYLVATVFNIGLMIVSWGLPPPFDPLPYFDEAILNPFVSQGFLNWLFVELAPQWLVNDYLDWFEQQNQRPDRRNNNSNDPNDGFVRDADYRMIGKGRNRND